MADGPPFPTLQGPDDRASMELAEASPDQPLSSFYSRHPLDRQNKEIRLLNLKPPINGKLVGRLEVVSLQGNSADMRKFAAVSYVWNPTDAHGGIGQTVGPQTDSPCTILLSAAFELNITANCHAALKQIQQNQGKLGIISIWIDSICINQDDEVEKAWQVKDIMGQVYRVANSVYVWLGEGTNETDRAMDYLMQFAVVAPRIQTARYAAATGVAGLASEVDRWQPRTWADRIHRLRLSFGRRPDPRLGSDIDELLSTPWTTRIWTFQEIVLASHPVILRGDRVLTWGEMLTAVYCPDTITHTGALKRRNIPSKLLAPFREPREKVATWRSIMDFWLAFPRDLPHNRPFIVDADAESGLPDPKSFHEAHDVQHRKSTAANTPWWAHLHAPVWIKLLILIPPLAVYLYFFCTTMNPERMENLSMSSDTEAIVGIVLTNIMIAAALIILAFTLFRHDRIWFTLLGYPGNVLGSSHQHRDQGQQTLLAGIQRVLRHRACGDRRDRAYGLWGILEALKTEPGNVDYRKPVGAAYRDLVETLLKWQPAAIGLILDAGRPLDGAPSWVPHWSGGPEDIPSAWLSFQYELRARQTTALAITPVAYPTVKDGCLRILARLHGVASSIQKFDDRGSPRTSQKTDFLIWALQARHDIRHSREKRELTPSLRTLLRYYRYPEASTYAVARGLVPAPEELLGARWETFSSYKRSQRPPFSGEEDEFGCFMELLESFSDTNAAPLSNEAVRNTIQNVEGADDLLDKIIRGAVDSKRCLFVLSTGLIGSGPVDMRRGDEVLLLQGVQAPMVLRPVTAATEDGTTTNARYKVVGAAFVHGIMHADYLVNWPDGLGRPYDDQSDSLPPDIEMQSPESWDKKITIV